MPHTIRLATPFHRDLARALIAQAPDGYTVTVSAPRRTLDQNARMWAMLSDISRAKPEGRAHPPETWKSLMMHACGFEIAFLSGLDGEPFPTGWRTSRLTKRQMANLITFIAAYGDQHGVQWSEPHPDETITTERTD